MRDGREHSQLYECHCLRSTLASAWLATAGGINGPSMAASMNMNGGAPSTSIRYSPGATCCCCLARSHADSAQAGAGTAVSPRDWGLGDDDDDVSGN
jgi:hypothetical protein